MATAQRIAFVCPRFSEGATVGGAETLLKNLADRAAAAGRTVTFLTTCAQNHFTWENTLPPGHKRVGQLDVHYFPVNDNRDLETFLRVQEAISRSGAFTIDEERAWIRNSVNSDALIEHLRTQGDAYDRIIMGPYLFGLVFFAAHVHPEKTWLVPCLHDEPFAYLRIMRELFGASAGFLFNTEPERDLAQHLFDIPDAKCHIVGMGLEPFDVAPDAFATRRNWSAPYIMYSGRREPLKGTPLLLDYMTAFRQRTGQDIRLCFTGSGPIEPPDELAPHVTDLGFVSEQEKREAMAGALAFIHPSVNESLGIVLLEAWLARTPALVHADSAVLRWQCRRSGGGLWFHNYPEFEEELLLLARNKSLANQMGEAGRTYVKEVYAWPAVEQRLFQALDG